MQMHTVSHTLADCTNQCIDGWHSLASSELVLRHEKSFSAWRVRHCSIQFADAPETRNAIYLQFAKIINLRSSAFICGSFFAEAPQINLLSSIKSIFANFAFWYEKVQYISHLILGCGSANINSELVRTRYELELMSSFKFVLSSVLIAFFIVIYEPRFIADFAVRKS